MTEQTKTPETDAVPNRITWQPIDTAPKDGTELLLSCPTGDAIANGAWIGLGWAWPYLRREPAYWQHMPLLPGHYEDEGGICNVCGGGIRYGERHYRCGESVMKIERERDELRAENERLRTIVPGTVERLNDELCDENETLRTERDAARAERDAAVVANCPALCHEFCNAYQVHKRVWEVETNLSRAIAERDAAKSSLATVVENAMRLLTDGCNTHPRPELDELKGCIICVKAERDAARDALRDCVAALGGIGSGNVPDSARAVLEVKP